MVNVILRGRIEDIERRADFTTIKLKQHGHSKEMFKISMSNLCADESGVIDGRVADCDCILKGNYPYNNIYCHTCITARTYKELEEKIINDYE